MNIANKGDDVESREERRKVREREQIRKWREVEEKFIEKGNKVEWRVWETRDETEMKIRA